VADRVAVVGLGRMGLPIARNLLGAGYALTVHNRTRARAEELLREGATWAGSPAAAARESRIVITMVADDAALEAVAFGERPSTWG